jgi:ABC-type glycerol-3-phosphate transport system substrate-binding protein
MSKKILAVVLVLAMTLGMVCMMTGCGSSSSDEATLTIWTHNDEDSWNESYQSIVDAYMEEHPDVKINIESLDCNFGRRFYVENQG